MEHEHSYQYLTHIDSPADLRALPVEALPDVCAELRRYLIEELAKNPGHFASSLGAVEMTVALHYVMNTPRDLLVWDVGHQAYGHKVLTGRRDAFPTNRKLHGLRPFPSPAESPYDTFACGHASNSISAALGMSVAAVRHGEADRHVVAIIGDGAMSGGLSFEGLNNASETPNNLLIVLNDNNMSIDHSVGGMKQYLLHLHTSPWYNRLRFRISRQLSKWGWLDEGRKGQILRFNNSLKSLLTNQQNVFEGMNIRYFGPTDGHNVIELVRILREIKDMEGPKILHIHTTKGKGYEPAEKEATLWHAPGKFDVESGQRIGDGKNTPMRYQDVFGHALVELARQNPQIVGVTPAMPTGCSMNLLMQEMPDRAFDVGIAEGHAVTFSAGMAKEGLLPFCNIYSSFAQRAYDNVIHDAALLGLPLVLCLDRAGIVGQDGATHHGVFDIAALRPVPGLTISSPYDEHELRRLMYTASQPGHGVFVIRYPRGCGRLENPYCPFETIPIGRGRCLKEGRDLAILTLGPIGHTAAEAIAAYEAQHPDISIAHYDMRFVKPLDTQLLDEVAQRFDRIITLEDGVVAGGMGSAILEYLNEAGHTPRLKRLGVPDEFVEHGKPEELYHLLGMDSQGVQAAIAEILA